MTQEKFISEVKHICQIYLDDYFETSVTYLDTSDESMECVISFFDSYDREYIIPVRDSYSGPVIIANDDADYLLDLDGYGIFLYLFIEYHIHRGKE